MTEVTVSGDVVSFFLKPELADAERCLEEVGLGGCVCVRKEMVKREEKRLVSALCQP